MREKTQMGGRPVLILESEAGTLLLYSVCKREERGYYQQLKTMVTGVFEEGCCVSGEGGQGPVKEPLP